MLKQTVFIPHSLIPCIYLCFAAACTPSRPATHSTASIVERTQMKSQILTKTSPYTFNETVDRLRANIEKRPLKLFAEIDHSKGAASIDLELAPSTVFIFGNPKGGTPLMTRNPQIGIVLPLKMHVYQTNGVVMVSYPDMLTVTQSYGLDNTVQPVPNIGTMLEGLANDVITIEE